MADSPRPADQVRSLGRVYQLVSEFVAPIILGLLIDWQAKTAPWGTIVGVLLGLLVGGLRVVQLSKQLGANDPPPRKDGSP